eukprot:767994-Hanusia_phi.AAC.5
MWPLLRSVFSEVRSAPLPPSFSTFVHLPACHLSPPLPGARQKFLAAHHGSHSRASRSPPPLQLHPQPPAPPAPRPHPCSRSFSRQEQIKPTSFIYCVLIALLVHSRAAIMSLKSPSQVGGGGGGGSRAHAVPDEFVSYSSQSRRCQSERRGREGGERRRLGRKSRRRRGGSPGEWGSEEGEGGDSRRRAGGGSVCCADCWGSSLCSHAQTGDDGMIPTSVTGMQMQSMVGEEEEDREDRERVFLENRGGGAYPLLANFPKASVGHLASLFEKVSERAAAMAEDASRCGRRRKHTCSRRR